LGTTTRSTQRGGVPTANPQASGEKQRIRRWFLLKQEEEYCFMVFKVLDDSSIKDNQECRGGSVLGPKGSVLGPQVVCSKQRQFKTNSNRIRAALVLDHPNKLGHAENVDRAATTKNMTHRRQSYQHAVENYLFGGSVGEEE
jgi:hypothetical protein